MAESLGPDDVLSDALNTEACSAAAGPLGGQPAAAPGARGGEGLRPRRAGRGGRSRTSTHERSTPAAGSRASGVYVEGPRLLRRARHRHVRARACRGAAPSPWRSSAVGRSMASDGACWKTGRRRSTGSTRCSARPRCPPARTTAAGHARRGRPCWPRPPSPVDRPVPAWPGPRPDWLDGRPENALRRCPGRDVAAFRRMAAGRDRGLAAPDRRTARRTGPGPGRAVRQRGRRTAPARRSLDEARLPVRGRVALAGSDRRTPADALATGSTPSARRRPPGSPGPMRGRGMKEVPAGPGTTTGRTRSASPGASTRCSSCSATDSPTTRSPAGCLSERRPSTTTSPPCSRSWASGREHRRHRGRAARPDRELAAAGRRPWAKT